ncbi:MAG: glycosyltransferase [Firmicutes bacterium]|nr:glycosyltransferase [Bacillota bacterium]
MNIYINARFLTQSVSGVQRYAIEVVKEIDSLIEKNIDNKNSFYLLTPRNIKSQLNLKNIPIRKVGYLKGHLWEQLELPYYSRNGLLVNLCNVAPLLKNKQIITMHDASVFAYPNAYSFSFAIWYKILFVLLGRIAKRILTVSRFSKDELVRYCKIKKEKISVIYLGKEHVYNCKVDKQIIEKHKLENTPFILAVSSMNPNKNFTGIINAIKLLNREDLNIVIAGGINHHIFDIQGEILSDRIKHLGYVSDGELRALYEAASCFVFPSFYEGFGLPPIEAMAYGCPVIVSEVASLPEICGDAALYCDPYNPNDIAEKIRMIIDDETLREALTQAGKKHVKVFTWEKCAMNILQVINSIIEK